MKFPSFKKQTPTQQQTDKKTESGVFNYEDGDDAWVESLDTRIEQSHEWFNSHYKLDDRTKKNRRIYLGEPTDSTNNSDDDDDGGSLENRIFTATRTMISTAISQVTQPEAYPSSKEKSARNFAEDIEKALYIHAQEENMKQKAKFALQDGVIVRRGYLKPRYDAVRHNFCTFEYVPAESIIADHKAKPYEELRHFRHILDKSVEDMTVMFPDMADKILELYGFDNKTPKSQLQENQKLDETWCFVPSETEGLDLIVTWSAKKKCLGKMQDPNWRYGKSNFIDFHMMPLVEFNILSDGKTHVDHTAYIEQARALQLNLDERKRQISQNAGLGNTGMPVVDSAALADDQSEFLSFDENTVLELDVSSANGQSIRDVFTTWQAAPLPNFVYEDMVDSRSAIDNTFAAPAVQQGQKSNSPTLGQDLLLRDNSQGRIQEIIDSVDTAMDRAYKLMAQFLLVYGDEQEMFSSNGENSEFDYVIINTDKLDTQAKIRAKSGTSMPVDRSQRRAVAQDASAKGMIDPLTYWETMDAPNAQKFTKRLMDYKLNPYGYLQEDDGEEMFDRDAYVDIELMKNGATPPFRTNLSQNYYAYLNQYVLSGDLVDPTIPQQVKAAITQFIQQQLVRGQQQFAQLQTQVNKSPMSPMFDKPKINIDYKDVEDPISRAAMLQLAGLQTNVQNLAPTSPAILENAMRQNAALLPPQDIPGSAPPQPSMPPGGQQPVPQAPPQSVQK